MKEKLTKYGKYLFSLAGLSVLMGMPLAALADWQANLTQFNTTARLSGNTGGGDLILWIGTMIYILMGFSGILLVLYFIWAGFTWMTAGGDPKKVETAQTRMKQAVIGIIIIFAAYAITNFVMTNLVNITSGNTPQ